MWPRKKGEHAAATDHESAADVGRPDNRYTFRRSTYDWETFWRNRYRSSDNEKRFRDFEHKDFCAVNRDTAWRAQGPASAVVLRCAPVWETDPVPVTSLCRLGDHWSIDSPTLAQSKCLAEIEAMAQGAGARHADEVWHMPLDETTIDDARRHCGMPVGNLSDAARRTKDDLEIALMCERNAKSDAPRGIKTAITQFCQETKPDAEAAIRRMAQEARAGDFTVTCLQKRLGLVSPKT
ncbi:hypothetical protein pqer_cds_702 [Pandoravirus quercus]|uniref:Uncharacterized protein n=1 Tax=Pandoravirus quercus TaxID=2107709 RepID=A0A2U7U9L3_9VIRU|nr:hypothetical protein pqer_cds_702 [Pandoravirus quercus]AVK75124.1 hypothetical protein pqer_cds_702 [Pandoravirus quercus]